MATLIDTKYKSLCKAKEQYDAKVSDLEIILQNKIEFEFSIIYHSSDGFCILNIENASLAGLETCISIIESEGFLTQEKFNEYTI